MADVLFEPQRKLFTKAVSVSVEVRNLKHERIGCCVVLTSDVNGGLILTAHHVIAGTVRNYGRKICRVTPLELPSDSWEPRKRRSSYVADVIYMDREADIAVLRLRHPPKRLKFAELGDSASLAVNDDLVKVGRSDHHPLAAGAITAIGKHDGVPEIEASMRAYSGDSGGALFDIHGRAVAITLRSKRGRKHVPRSFAIPIHEAVRRIMRCWDVRIALRSYVGHK